MTTVSFKVEQDNIVMFATIDMSVGCGRRFSQPVSKWPIDFHLLLYIRHRLPNAMQLACFSKWRQMHSLVCRGDCSFVLNSLARPYNFADVIDRSVKLFLCRILVMLRMFSVGWRDTVAYRKPREKCDIFRPRNADFDTARMYTTSL